MDQEKARFNWHDYADGNTIKVMELINEEFIRRFLFHILPHGFTRTRHYGLYASRNKSIRLEACRRSIGSRKNMKPEESSLAIICRILGRDVTLCPRCGKPLAKHALARASPA